MKKHLFSSLGLALMMLVWGGASEVKAQATYTEVKSVDFSAIGERTIPTGWTVVNSEDYKAATETTAEVTGIRASGSYTWSGPGIRVFTNGIPFQKAFYIRATWPTANEAQNDGFAYYGDLADNEIELEPGNYELRVPAFLWNNGGSSTIRVEVLKNDGTELSALSPAATLSAAVSALKQIATIDQKLTYNVAESLTNDLDGIDKDKVVLRFEITETTKIIIKVSAITTVKNDNNNWTSIMFGGFNLYSYTGTPSESKYDDEATVFAEDFTSATNNYSPDADSGWTIYKDGGQRDAGTDFNYNGSRIFGGLSGSKKLQAAYYCENENTFIVYGETEPYLELEAGNYFVSYYAVSWKKTGVKASFSVLDSFGEVVETNTTELIDNCWNASSERSDRTKSVTPNHIQFVVTIPSDGIYLLKLTSSDEALLGNITIRKNTDLTAISEMFTGLSDASPAAGSGWTLHKDDSNGTVVANGQTGLSMQARIMTVSGSDIITNAAYLRYSGYITYGENDEIPLTLVGDKEYRISYYAASQDDEKASITCQIYGKDSGKELGTALSRIDYLAGQITSGKMARTADYIETTFTPKKSGEYILKFVGRQVHVGNITLAENYADPIVYQTKLDDAFGYSTLYVDQAAAIPEGVEVYSAVLNDDGNKVVLTQINDNIPAGTAVIVKGTPGATATFKAATAIPEEVESNVLAGKLVGTALPTDATYYTLAYTDADDESTLGFYKSSAVALRANKAYIAISGSSSISSLRFDFDTDEPGNVTAIEQVKSEAAAGAIFDLNGRRVATMNKPGLYVVGGRKVLVK
jgi:hypothetical protein